MLRETHYKPGPPGSVVEDSHFSLVIGDDGTHYGEPQPGAPLLSCEVGLEDTVLIRSGDTWSVIGDLYAGAT